MPSQLCREYRLAMCLLLWYLNTATSPSTVRRKASRCRDAWATFQGSLGPTQDWGRRYTSDAAGETVQAQLLPSCSPHMEGLP